ncbi:phage antirepressor [Asaia sp. VD9]|uniref:phage antirepressor n=1 Tax=Asaia sp. VD9 TaxID=3081235 RepID=UPI0030184B89
MNEMLIPLSFEGREIRVVTIGGEPFFVGRDVAERLGYANATDALAKHCRGVAKRYPIVDALGRTQDVRVLSEPDVLRLIVRSKRPEAERFERWVFEEVLPAIRKTGGYMTAAPEETPEALAARALAVLQATVTRQKAALAETLPKAEVYDRLVNAEGSLCITAAAKNLHMRPKALFDWLAHNGWIYRRPGADHWLGYQAHTSNGDLDHKITTVTRPDGSEKVTEQVRITAKGLARLEKLMPERLHSVA